MSQWSAGGGNERVDNWLRWAGIGGAALLVIGSAYLAGQRALSLASQRLTPGLTRGASREVNSGGSGAAPSAAPYRGGPGSPARFSPGVPGVPNAAVAYAPPPPPPVSFSAAPGSLSGPFITEAERAQAGEALGALREVMETTRKCDSASFFKAPTPPSAAAGGTARPAGAAVNQPGAAMGGPAADPAAAEAAIRYADRVRDETEGIATQLDLFSHPERFPRPMRDGVGEMAKEIRIYLNTARLASTRPDQQQQLHTQASKHLARSEEFLRQMESLAGGGGGGSAAN